ncbi:MAG: hypothetical protein KC635_06640, partial [Myxococcales bacterium]|nr:hypothetical protein [Myxococcales bacterium]
PGTPLASRVVTPQPLPEIEIGGVALTPDELAALSARVTAHLESGARPALDLLASANAAVARAVTGGPDALSLDPDEDVSDFDEFFEWCVGAHDGRTLWGFVRQYRRFVFAVPLPPAPWGDQDALFEYDPDWRAVVDPRDPALDGFLRRYLAHRFFSAFERSPATGFVAFNYGSVNHTLGSAFRVAVGLSRWLGRPVDKDVMKVAVGASEYLFRTLSLPAVAMPWFRLDVNEKLTLLEEDQTPGSTEG